MNEKVTLQAISDIFASQYGISKKTTDAFGKSFFDTIVDGLNQDGLVKIKGLGTFKIVNVGSRESVNVTNGERIVIDGYKKVSFTPDELPESKKEELVQSIEEEVAMAAEKAQEEVSDVVLSDDVQPENVETPKDELSGIDMLISTPESIDEIKKDLDLARERAERAMEEAKSANVEYRRLQLLVERMENNQAPAALVRELANASISVDCEPETVEEPVVEENTEETVVEEPQDNIIEEPVEEVEEEEETPSAPADTKNDNQATMHLFNNQDEDEEEEDEEYDYRKIFMFLAFAIVILIGIAIYLYCNSKKYSQPASIAESSIVRKHRSNGMNELEDSLAEQHVNDSVQLTIEKRLKNRESLAKKADRIAKRTAEARRAAEAKKAAEKKAAEKKAADAKKELEAKKKAAEAKKKTHRVHVLQEGENLFMISRKYYGTNDSIHGIYRLNKFANPNNVPVGTKVILP